MLEINMGENVIEGNSTFLLQSLVEKQSKLSSQKLVQDEHENLHFLEGSANDTQLNKFDWARVGINSNIARNC